MVIIYLTRLARAEARAHFERAIALLELEGADRPWCMRLTN